VSVTLIRLLSATAIAAAFPFAAFAQDYTLGQAEYMNSCAQCHGASGLGDGVIAGMLNTRVPDLTQLQNDNGGVFPVTALYGLIDGTDASGIHGSRDMPAWGMRYSFDAPEMLGWDYSEADQQAFVRARILALIEYIATLQQ
jgi:mono/diheme cytochrome c family protein